MPRTAGFGKCKTRIIDAIQAQQAMPQLYVCGWARTVRRGKDVAFIALNDGSCLANLQVVLTPELACFETASRCGTGAALAIDGELVASPASGQAWELHARQVKNPRRYR